MARQWGYVYLSGTKDGTNVLFSIPGLPSGLVWTWIYRNGVIQDEVSSPANLGLDECYRQGFAVTFGDGPNSGEKLWCVFADETAIITAVAEIKESFYYEAHIYDVSGARQLILRTEIESATWQYSSIGGCTEADIILHRPFDFLLYLGEDYEVEIRRNVNPTSLVGTTELRWSGYIRDLIPKLDEPERVELQCSGFSRQLEQLIVTKFTQSPNKWTNVDVGQIVRDVLDFYVIPGSKIKRSVALNLVPNFGIIVSDFGNTMMSAAEAIRTLAEYAGDAEWGVRADREFYFLPRSQAVKNQWPIGGRIRYYHQLFSSDQKVNRVFIQGSNSTRFIVQGAAYTTGNQKERVLPVGSIATSTEAALYASGFFAKYAPANSKPSGRLKLEATSAWIESVGVPLGLLRVFGGPVFAGIDALSNPILYGQWTDTQFRVQSIQYRAGDDSLDVDIDLGAKGNKLSDYLVALERKFAELRQMQ